MEAYGSSGSGARCGFDACDRVVGAVVAAATSNAMAMSGQTRRRIMAA